MQKQFLINGLQQWSTGGHNATSRLMQQALADRLAGCRPDPESGPAERTLAHLLARTGRRPDSPRTRRCCALEEHPDRDAP